MMLTFLHPRLDELTDFSSGGLSRYRRRHVAAHLRSCTRCQAALRFVKRLENETVTLPDVEVPPALLPRILEARARGDRAILAAAAETPRPLTTSVWRVGGMSAAVAVLLLVLLARYGDLGALEGESEMLLTPSQPRLGDRIEVSYRPAPGLFRGEDSLTLRARFRNPRDAMYPTAVPAHRVRRVATLQRSPDGSYRASFVLPDSIVFASLAVEDAAASHVDDHGGRLWEVLTYGPDGMPLFDALRQRVNDMMGRSWEEGYVTARRLAELYPERIRAWTLREFFERALFTGEEADSIGAVYEARLDTLIEEAKHLPIVPEDDIGTILFRFWVKAARSTSPADSSELTYWWERIQREYPRHAQVAQKGASDLAARYHEQTAVLLDSLESMYFRLAPLEGPGNNLIIIARQVAESLGDEQAYRRWIERSWTGTADSARQVALVLVQRESARAEGMDILRQRLAMPPEHPGSGRALTRTARQQAERVDAGRRRILAALGRALIAEGNSRAGLDTLALAAEGTWDVGLFRDIASARLAAGDTAGAHLLHARLTVDPRTHADMADQIVLGRKYLGPEVWDSSIVEARKTLYAHQLERATVRRLRGTARLMTAARRTHSLSDLTGRQPAVVIFWSRGCGAALEALPSILEVGERLRKSGTPVIMVLDEGPSEELTDFLARKEVTLPIYHDVNGSTKDAFTNFGTPQYFVLDAEGRIRFDSVDGEAELIAQVAALGGPQATAVP